MIKFFILLYILVAVVADQWAVILVGSNGFWNYRHQADACHAYQLHKINGIEESHIILLSYDDVARSVYNPLPGQLFNKGGRDPPNVYKNCKVTYSGVHVSSVVYKAVLTGDAETIKNCTGLKNPVVLNSTKDDTVMLSFFDHGSTDTIYFPDYDDFMSSDDLMDIFQIMHSNNMYKKMIYYMESSFSGSMFTTLNSNMSIYSVSATNDKEFSWGYYCKENAIVNGTYIGTCLGDLFSISWLEDSDLHRNETVGDQYIHIIERTNLSHPQQFGEKNIMNDSVWEFIGNNNSMKYLEGSYNVTISLKGAIKSEDIYMQYLEDRLNSEKNKNMIVSIIEEEKNYRKRTDTIFSLLLNRINKNKEIKENIMDSNLSYKRNNNKCYHDVVEAHKIYCGKSREYTIKYFPVLMKLCEYCKGNSKEIITEIKNVCNN